MLVEGRSIRRRMVIALTKAGGFLRATIEGHLST
jgi:hypothetical protein